MAAAHSCAADSCCVVGSMPGKGKALPLSNDLLVGHVGRQLLLHRLVTTSSGTAAWQIFGTATHSVLGLGAILQSFQNARCAALQNVASYGFNGIAIHLQANQVCQRGQRDGQHADGIVCDIQAIQIAHQADLIGQLLNFVVAQIEDLQMW